MQNTTRHKPPLIGAFSKLRKAIISFDMCICSSTCLSVCLSVRTEQLSSHLENFVEI
jgi:hypothetical protein